MSSSQKIHILSIEGNIGAGKTTLLDHLEGRLANKNWIVLREPVHLWNAIQDKEGVTMLSKFYEDPKKYAFAFQIMAFTSRLQELRRVIRENPTCQGIICERSLEADQHIFAKMLYDDGLIEDVMYEIYQTLNQGEFVLDGVIYLDVSPEVCHQRIAKRSREGESGIALEYLQKCRDYHTKWLLQRNSVMAMHIAEDADATFDSKDLADPGIQYITRILCYIDELSENTKKSAPALNFELDYY